MKLMYRSHSFHPLHCLDHRHRNIDQIRVRCEILVLGMDRRHPESVPRRVPVKALRIKILHCCMDNKFLNIFFEKVYYRMTININGFGNSGYCRIDSLNYIFFYEIFFSVLQWILCKKKKKKKVPILSSN